MGKMARKLVGVQLVEVERQRQGRFEIERTKAVRTGLYVGEGACDLCDQGSVVLLGRRSMS